MCTETQRKLCDDNNCQICFNRSFASSLRSQYWNNDLNINQLPRQFHLNSHQKFWFNCDTCKHTFIKSLNDITNNSGWCGYCGNRLLCERVDCEFCFEKSFASVPKSEFWNVELNKDIASRQIRKNTQKNYWFDCDKCNHSFEMTPNNINYGAWCIYCAHLKLCDDDTCQDCFEKSFASRDNPFWSTKNEMTPRQVFKNTSRKHWFDCDICHHSYLQIVSNVVNRGDGCHYCSSNKLCDDDDCDFCFRKSFASHHRSEFWHKDLNQDKNPRQFHLNSNKKFWFKCDVCDYNFDSHLLNIVTGKNWCPNGHYNITELKLFTFLKEKFQDTIQQATFDWCKSNNSSRLLRYDFVIPSKKIIIELDGEQHFKQVWNWQSHEERQEIDIYKMKCARENDYRIIRLLQVDVKVDKFDWGSELLESIEHTISIEYICKNNEYDIYKDKWVAL